jgi:hypothetical protein
MIVEDTQNRFFLVRDTGDANLAHVWFGIEVKRAKGGFAPKKNARETLVRRAGCRIVVEG